MYGRFFSVGAFSLVYLAKPFSRSTAKYTSRSLSNESYLTKQSEVYLAKLISRSEAKPISRNLSREAYLTKRSEVYFTQSISRSLSPLNPRISAETAVNSDNCTGDKCGSITAKPLQGTKQIFRLSKSS